MHAIEVFLILVINLIIIFILYGFQKRLLKKSVRHLKEEIQELEDLVAAIIEEFQEIAAINENRPKSEPILPENRELSGKYPTVGEFLDNLNHSDLVDGSNPEIDNINLNSTGANLPDETVTRPQIHSADTGINIAVGEDEYQPGDPLPDKSDKSYSVPQSENVTNSEFISDPKHRKIFDLWQQGLSVEEIARRLGKGRGEIQLVLGIYRRS